MELTSRMKKNAALSRTLAAESMVLLRNVENTLPLTGTPEAPDAVALFGVGQIYTVKGGTGSGNVNNLKTVSLLEGMIADPCLRVNALLARKYRTWCMGHENLCVEGFMEPKGSCNPEMPLSREEVAQAAAESDTAVMVVTRVAGEGSDMRAEPGMILLTAEEKALMDHITACFSRTVLLLNTAGFLELEDYAAKFTAVLFMGLPGQDAGAVADVLTGKVLPSGHLTDTWPLRYDQYPTAGEFSKQYGNGNMADFMGRPQEQIDVKYTEDIFVGYRYFDSFREPVRYPFGFGLTYGASALTGWSLSATGDEIAVSVTVENTGEIYPVRQVVQVYVSCPEGKLDQPLNKLCAFGKTKSLRPGESQELTMTFRLSDAASFDAETGRELLEAGCYVIRVGTDSRTTSVAGAVVLPETVTVRNLSNRMGDVPPDFKPLSNRGVPAYTYPGEAEELEFAKAHAIRLRARDFSPVTVRYDPPPKALTRRRTGLRLADVEGKICSLREFVASMDASSLCALCCGVGMEMQGMPEAMREDPDFVPPFEPMEGTMLVPGAAGQTADLWETCGIPAVSLADGPAGIRITREIKDADGELVRRQICTAFPVGSLLACSWDMDVLRRFGEAVALEMQEYGVDIWLAPGMNIHRDPLCGRNFEYFSEDPLVSGLCAAAVTAGVQKSGLGVTIKHFAGNEQETLRACSNDIVTQRALREIYLKGFEIAVKRGDPFCVMTSYNDIGGLPSANNPDLTTAILRDEWGFRGFVMTDWGGGISRPALSLCAGNDMIQPGGPAVIRELAEALASEEPVKNRGLREYSQKLTLAELQLSALHILRVLLRCGSVRRKLREELASRPRED